MAKRLIRLFGFQVHDAPGEAEAECALLQQTGIVDAVLSEDVDTIMFGCTRTLKNWSSEGTKGSKTPTHVSMYDTEELLKAGTGLDREGMVLVALMSGGDYLPEGIPGAGVKLACEAARAGFGKSLCKLKRSDVSELASWKEWLTYELRHNESGFFRTRHKALSVPESFPNLDILRYYTHPVVSPVGTLDRLRNQQWDKPVDVQGLREFVRETFDWNYRIGAIKFIRVLAPSLLVRKMMFRSAKPDHSNKSIDELEKEELELANSITNRRIHFSTDATPELRISFVPTNIVGYDFQEEPDEVIDYGRDGLALNSDDEFEVLAEDEGAEAVARSGSRKPFNPIEPNLFWIPETIVKLGVPITVEDWEEAQRAKMASRQKTKAPKKKAKTRGTAAGAFDKFVKVTKNVPRSTEANKDITPTLPKPSSPARIRNPLSNSMTPSQSLPPLSLSDQTPQKAQPTRSSKRSKSKASRKASLASGPDASTNPWTIASSQASPRITRFIKASETITISSSPPASPITDRRSPVRRTGGRGAEENSSLNLLPPSAPASPHKQRSITPAGSAPESDGVSNPPAVRALSPSPKPSEKKPRGKLVRTESLLNRSKPQAPPTISIKERQFARARTVAVETLLSGSEDSELDLPHLNSIAGSELSKGNISCSCSPNSKTEKQEVRSPGGPSVVREKFQEDQNQRQTELDGAFGDAVKTTTKRMTKVYMPRKSEPGFFREVEVAADEADVLLAKTKEQIIKNAEHSSSTASSKRGATAAAWRRSDISCIDLTSVD
ncbi:hypothetical protein AAE478_006348 [Parahypoxylon ruwenzoriense]